MRQRQIEGPLAQVLDAIAVPSRDENAALVARAQAGDEDARGELVVRNLRLVVSIAVRYRAQTLELAELVAEGVTGLLRAAATFDTSRGAAFATYAICWIRQRVAAAWRDQDQVVRLPRHVRDRTPLVLASLDAPLGFCDDGEPETLAALLQAGTEAPEDAAARAEAIERLRAALQRLPERQRIVLEMRFGLVDGEPRTHREVARRFGLSSQRACQIEAQALRRLREMHCQVEVPRPIVRPERREGVRVRVRRTPAAPVHVRLAEIACHACGVRFTPRQRGVRYCGAVCRVRFNEQAQRERRRHPVQPLAEIACRMCGVRFAPTKRSARYCGPPCRARYHWQAHQRRRANAEAACR